MWYRLGTNSTMTLKNLLSRCRAFGFRGYSEKGLRIYVSMWKLVKLIQSNTVIILHNNHKYHRNIWLSTL